MLVDTNETVSLDQPFWVGDRFVEPLLNQVTFEGQVLKIEHQVMQVLLCLASRPNKPVSREIILQTVWSNTMPNDEGLTQAICKLRKVLGDDPGEASVIQTIRKVGYRLLVPVTSEPETRLSLGDSLSPDNSGQLPRRHIRIRIHGNMTLLAALVLLTAFNIWLVL